MPNLSKILVPYNQRVFVCGTDRYQKIKTLRSASERTNSVAKENLSIPGKPKIRGLKYPEILTHVVITVLLLKWVICLIVKVIHAIKKISSNLTCLESPIWLFAKSK
jgi:hypothetical protein